MAPFVLRAGSSGVHARPSGGAGCLVFGRALCLLPCFVKFVCAGSGGSGGAALVRRLAWAFTGRLCEKSHGLVSWLNGLYLPFHKMPSGLM